MSKEILAYKSQSPAELETIFIGDWKQHFQDSILVPAQKIIEGSIFIKHGLSELMESLPQEYSKEDRDLVYFAGQIAIVAHDGQLRKEEQLPYVIHPLRIAANVAGQRFNGNPPSSNEMVTAILHDVPEDCDIKKLYGGDVDWPTYLDGLFQFSFGLDKDDSHKILESIALLQKSDKPKGLTRLTTYVTDKLVDGINWSAEIIERNKQSDTGQPDQMNKSHLTQSDKISTHFLTTTLELNRFSGGKLFRPDINQAWEIVIKMTDCVDNLAVGRTTFPKAMFAAFLVIYGRQLGMKNLSDSLDKKLNDVITKDRSININPFTRRIFMALLEMSNWLPAEETTSHQSFLSDIRNFLKYLITLK